MHQYTWLATNLKKNDLDMLTSLFDQRETAAAGYQMNNVLSTDIYATAIKGLVSPLSKYCF
jgi:hypothetical protein